MTLVSITGRLLIGLLVVIPVGVMLVVAWPLILIGVVIVALSLATEAWSSRSNRPARTGANGKLVSPVDDPPEALPDAVAPKSV